MTWIPESDFRVFSSLDPFKINLIFFFNKVRTLQDGTVNVKTCRDKNLNKFQELVL
jgi:hypothetical protein